MGITEGQKLILDYIKKYADEHKQPISKKELLEGLGVTKVWAHKKIKYLLDNGFIRRGVSSKTTYVYIGGYNP